MDDARPAGSSGTYRCGGIEIDPTRRRMTIDGVPARIGARAFDVLLALLERRDRVVPKPELMDLVWPKLVVEENNLLVHMVALRKLLGPQAIITIPGRGYRFVMQVDAVPREGSEIASVRPALGNLPATPPLFGRAQDLDAMAALLREHAVVSIVGAAGIGKTCLALASAVRITAPDGCWWVELAAINEGSRVPNTIAGALGIQLPAGRDPSEALASALANKKLLLVVDNCEHLADDIGQLIDLLRERAVNVRLLVTSQESLKCQGEQVYRLGALAVPAVAQLEEASRYGAVALFVERAHAADSRFRLDDNNVEMVVDVCRRLDGIPLAIELAAVRVPLLGVPGLHARLSQMFHVLSGGTRMKLRRHQTLRAALEWSYGLLSAEEQSAFRRLGVFAGGFSLELGQSVVGDERIDQWLVLDLLGTLIDKSLVITDGSAEPRYHLLETTRAFALEQLGLAGESDRMLQRHAQSIGRLMKSFRAQWWSLSPMEQHAYELGNLRAALDWASCGAGNRALAYELLGSCWFVWMQCGLAREGSQRMQQHWPPPPDLPAAVEADFCLGFARLHRNAPREEHWKAVSRAETLYRELGDSDGLAHALLLVVSIGAFRDRVSEAERALCEVERLISDTAAASARAVLAAAQGELFLRRGEPSLAIGAFRRQTEFRRGAGDIVGEYVALSNLGCAQLDAGDLDAAVETLRKSVEGMRRFSPPYALDFRLSTLAVALAWRGDGTDVLPLAREAFDNLRLLGVTFAPLIAAALQHARKDQLQRALVLAGYAHSRLPQQRHTRLIALPMQQWLKDLASAAHPPETVESWLHAGEPLTEDQAAAIAFNEASLALVT